MWGGAFYKREYQKENSTVNTNPQNQSKREHLSQNVQRCNETGVLLLLSSNIFCVVELPLPQYEIINLILQQNVNLWPNLEFVTISPKMWICDKVPSKLLSGRSVAVAALFSYWGYSGNSFRHLHTRPQNQFQSLVFLFRFSITFSVSEVFYVYTVPFYTLTLILIGLVALMGDLDESGCPILGLLVLA